MKPAPSLTPDGNPWQFYYDARLNRYKIDRGGSVRYLLWEGLNLMEERDNGGALVARYTYGYSPIYGIGNVVEIYLQATGLTYTLAMDHRGTGHVLLDNTGAEIGRRYYDAFGVILGETGSWPVDLAYQTNWQTIKIGSKWWGLSAARMYDFASGVFSQRDPVPNMIKVIDMSDAHVLGVFENTKLAEAALLGVFASHNDHAAYAKWFMNTYRAWSDDPISQIDITGLSGYDPGYLDACKARAFSPTPRTTLLPRRDDVSQRLKSMLMAGYAFWRDAPRTGVCFGAQPGSGADIAENMCGSPTAAKVVQGAGIIAIAATTVAVAALASEGLASRGLYNVGKTIQDRAMSYPFSGSRWFSPLQTNALLNTGRLANYAGSATALGKLYNWATTFYYGGEGQGEVVYNWVTRTVIHCNPFK